MQDLQLQHCYNKKNNISKILAYVLTSVSSGTVALLILERIERLRSYTFIEVL